MRARILSSLIMMLCLTACRNEPSTSATEFAETAEVTSTDEVVLGVITDAPSTPTSAPTATPRIKPERVIVLSIPNAGQIDALGSAPQHPMQSTEPATIAVAHNSLAAGRWPAEIGVVGERVHRPEDGIYWYTSAFEVPMQGAQPIWKVASDQGLTTAALFWPGATPTMPDQMADYTVGYGQRDAYSAQHVIGLYAAGSWSGAPESHSLMQEGMVAIEGDDAMIATAYILGIDTSDDGAANLDTFILSKDRTVSPDDPTFAVGEWTKWTLDSERGQGADFLITSIAGNTITIFQSRVYSMLASPEDWSQAVITQWGYFAPEPDWYGLNAGWITPAQYMQMVQRQSDWMMDVTLWVSAEYQPDILFTVQNPLDQAARQFLLVDPRQSGYSEERAAENRSYLEQAAAQIDQVVGRLIESQDNRTSMLVVSPSQLVPIHTRVNLNIALAEAGLLRLGRRGFVIMPATQAIGFSSGGAAHIYINAVGREEEGIVAPEEVDQVADEIIALLRGMVDPQTGELIFAQVERQNELESGAYAGDVYAQANLGYAIDDETDASVVFDAVSFYGHEGFESTGWVSIPGWDASGEIKIVDLAPTIAWLLDFTMSDTDGRSILED